MGSIVACTRKFDGKRYGGKALLDSDYIEFKGDTRLKIPFKSINLRRDHILLSALPFVV